MSRTNLMLIMAIILWGLAIPPTKWALETVQPMTLTFLRLALASVIFVPYAWKKSREKHSHVAIPWGRLCALSFTGVAGYFLLGYTGISLTSGVNTSIIDATLPLFTMLLAYFYLKERIVWQQWAGVLIGMGGVLLIALQSQTSNGSSLTGDLLVLASCVVRAIYIVQMKRPKGEEKLCSELFTALILMIGAVMILPFTIWETWMYGFPTFPPKTSWSIAFLTLGCSIGAYWLWNKALESVSASQASVLLNAMPLVSVIGSILLLRETITWQTIVGGCLVLLGVFIAERRRTEEIEEIEETNADFHDG